MTEGIVIEMESSTLIYQIGNEDCSMPEPAVLIRYYEWGPTLSIIQGDSVINLNIESIPALIKNLRAWHKTATQS